MKTFKQHIIERQEDIDELQLITSPPRTYDELMERLNSKASIIGRGSYGNVWYGVHGGDYIVRVTKKYNDPWYIWGEHSMAAGFNPNKPQVKFIGYFNNNQGYFSIVEKLEFDGDKLLLALNAAELWEDAFGNDMQQNANGVFGTPYRFAESLEKGFVQSLKNNPNIKHPQELQLYKSFISYHGDYMKQAYESLANILRHAGGVKVLDMHDENWGLRNNTPVITDPIG